MKSETERKDQNVKTLQVLQASLIVFTILNHFKNLHSVKHCESDSQSEDFIKRPSSNQIKVKKK